MKDINIKLTENRQRTELFIWLVCFIIAFGLNIFSIIYYKTEWKELLTQIGWVLALSILFYSIFLVTRLIYFSIRYLFKKKN
jgi:presenilin-like A22 family membrane protease